MTSLKEFLLDVACTLALRVKARVFQLQCSKCGLTYRGLLITWIEVRRYGDRKWCPACVAAHVIVRDTVAAAYSQSRSRAQDSAASAK